MRNRVQLQALCTCGVILTDQLAVCRECGIPAPRVGAMAADPEDQKLVLQEKTEEAPVRLYEKALQLQVRVAKCPGVSRFTV